MAKRPVKTFHLLEMAESIKTQNEAIGMLLIRIETSQGLAEHCNEKKLRGLIKDINNEAEKVRVLIWPQEE